MCGFVGVVGSSASGAEIREQLEALLPDLNHRGPDGSGIVVGNGLALAATRLRIQGDARSNQPAVSADGRIAVAFNGELFDCEQEVLRGRLSTSRAAVPTADAGDTALLAAFFSHALARDGSLDGPAAAPGWTALGRSMGALAVADLRDGVAWIGRDRFGVKPLVHSGGLDRWGEWWFASTLTPLFRLQSTRTGVSLVGLADLWKHQSLPEHLPWSSPRAALQGCWRRIDARRTQRGVPSSEGGETFADVEERRPASESDAARSRLECALELSARQAAAIDGPVSLFLSGGIDSAAVGALAGRRDLLALTGRFGPAGGAFDESEGAASTARALGLTHEILDLEDADLLADLEAVIRALELPVAGPGSLALWRLARRAREHGRVVLTGTGGDELLGGYARSALALGRAGAWTEGYEGLAGRMPRDGDPRDRILAALDRRTDLAPLFDVVFRSHLEAQLPQLEGWEIDDDGEYVQPGAAHPENRTPWVSALDAVVRAECTLTLPTLLHVEDRVLMAHGLEGRPVFCLGDVPNAALALPEDQVIGPDGEGKVALRAILKGRIPESVRLDKRKRGFPTPFGRAARGAGRERAEALLGDRRFRERGWWDVKACRALLDEERPPHDRALFALLSWETWARLFVDGDAWRSPAPVAAPGAPGR
jgi:asparagine synthase (glutamine-hydrolysing)